MDPWIDFNREGVAYLVDLPFNVAQDFSEA
jgi:hypothetical protein